ncbi:hypothetical protein XELAEV_18033040mg [Xenopus laevis]|uniref:Dynein heavy chain coiled coil stalk domain-containing protein n=1 Tax=Xenopus laevis TaxID=8355 RepID=A0A974CK27_XENLA|nr:hypothetical protein XELAEV_18033040mg [Xenopus laevis]
MTHICIFLLLKAGHTVHRSCLLCHFYVEDLKVKVASQEAELQLKIKDADALITKKGCQTEKLSQEKSTADA